MAEPEAQARAGTRAKKKPGGLEPGSERRTGGGPRAVGTMIDRLIGRAGQRRGFGEARVLTEWAAIVGPEIAGCTMPEKIARSRGEESGVLHLRVESGWAPTIQHDAPAIVERVNGFLGYRAVGKLVLRQGPIPRPPRRGPPRQRALTEEERRRIEEATARIEDPELAAALRALGQAVMARSSQQP